MKKNKETRFRSGAQLLADWNCKTREQKLERACIALMNQLDNLHAEHLEQYLDESLLDKKVTCSCIDAYRMGYAALVKTHKI